MNIKAIETSYKGYRFRSRLEARWAVFFDQLGRDWEYEKEGFDLGADGWYLPDFWLPYDFSSTDGDGEWIEIKPTDPSVEEIAKLDALVRATERRAFCFCGEPWPGRFKVMVWQHYNDDTPALIPLIADGALVQSANFWSNGERERFSPFSIEIRPSGEDCKRMQNAKHRGRFKFEIASELMSARKTSVLCVGRNWLQIAFEAARSARFEHGECGAKLPRDPDA